MPLRKTVKMTDELHASLTKLSEEKNITFQQAMERQFAHNTKLNNRIEELERELEQLKSQSDGRVGKGDSKTVELPAQSDSAITPAPVPLGASQNLPKTSKNTLATSPRGSADHILWQQYLKDNTEEARYQMKRDRLKELLQIKLDFEQARARIRGDERRRGPQEWDRKVTEKELPRRPDHGVTDFFPYEN